MELLEKIAVGVGMVYILLEYRASIWLWIPAIIMPAMYIFIYYHSGFYADMGISVYYVAAAVYGWAVWLGGKEGGERKPKAITRTPRRQVVPLTALAALCFGLILFVLLRFTDSDVPYGDSFTTALSIVGMWMLAQKYVEQWLVWIAVNVVSSGLYFYKDLSPTAVLYAAYAVIAVFGYFKWKRMMAAGE